MLRDLPNLPPTHKVRSNVFFYFILILVIFWDFVMAVISIVLQALKLYYFYAPTAPRNFSMVAPFLWFFICVLKFIASKKGNRSENITVSCIALVLIVGSIIMEIYFILWQPYLWRWEFPLHIVSIVLDGIILIFLIVLIIIFAVSRK
ncbi:hypothetical protein M9Y10_043470 [Tritrichomonas musculus]|uniref:Transmembrane protein n=1 Tax=Tritrichomonas musculus TaxID=1915356 RepID=A0ABR2K2N8_9EUKA